MAFVDEKFIPSGLYNIINVGQDRSVVHSDDNDEQLVAKSSNDTFLWSVTLLANKKWIIRSPASDVCVELPPDPEEGDDITVQPSQRQPHLWAIKRSSETQNSYMIYSPSNPGLFWGLSDAEEGTPLKLTHDDIDASSWWKFRRVLGGLQNLLDGMVRVVLPMTLLMVPPNLLAADRPTHYHVIGNKTTIIVPPGWLTTISAVSVGECINLIRVNHIVDGVLDTQDFTSTWDSIDKAMVARESGVNLYAVPATDQPSILVFEFFRSENRRRRDPLMLPERGELSSNLRITSIGRPDSIKTVSDYQTFWIFDENPSTSNSPSDSGPSNNAVLTVQSTKNDAGIDLVDPGNPAPATTNPGFNDAFDKPRPSTMDEYLKDYNMVIVVDDSSSMRGARWDEVRMALADLSKEAMQHDANGIDICFLNSPKHKESVATPTEVLELFDTVNPRGWTFTSPKLKSLLNGIIKKLDDAAGRPEYADIKPVDIVVITDYAPIDDPGIVIADAIQRLDSRKHHLNAVGIHFVQIGDEDGAEAALKLLTDCPLRRMVNTAPYTKALTQPRFTEIILGSLHPSINSAIAQKSSTSVRKCPTCRSDDIPEFDYPRFPPTSRCRHKPLACRECIARHVEAQLSSQAVILEVNCLSNSCPEKLGYDEIKQWASPDCFNRYNSETLRQRVSEGVNFIWCLNVKCDHGQIHPHGDAYPIVQCTWCYKKSCFTHRLPWHDGLTCEQFDATRPDPAEEEAAQPLSGSTTPEPIKSPTSPHLNLFEFFQFM